MNDAVATESVSEESGVVGGSGAVAAPNPPSAPTEPAASDLLSDPRLERFNFQDPSALVDSFVSAQDMLSRSVRFLGPDASEEARQQQIEKFKQHYPEALPAAAPENAQGYSFSEIEGFQTEPQQDQAMAELAHSMGLNNEQANTLRAALVEQAKSVSDTMDERVNTELAALQQEWGPAMDRNFKQAQHMLRVLDAAQPGLAERFEEYGANTDPQMMRFLYSLSKRMGESPIKEAGQYAGAMTPAEAQAKIDESQPWNNPQHPANNPMHPRHNEARKERDRLYDIVAGRA